MVFGMTDEEFKARCTPIAQILLYQEFSEEDVKYIMKTLIEVGMDRMKDSLMEEINGRQSGPASQSRRW